jgi:hypothetical protein
MPPIGGRRQAFIEKNSGLNTPPSHTNNGGKGYKEASLPHTWEVSKILKVLISLVNSLTTLTWPLADLPSVKVKYKLY